MLKFLQFIGQFQALRGRLSGLPLAGRWLLFLAALPGAILIALSIVAFFVSLLALLLLTLPVYRLVSWISGAMEGPGAGQPTVASQPASPEQVTMQATPAGQVNPATGRRHIEVTILE